MYNFEGQYRRIPQQNLAGASVQQKKDELLRQVHSERMKREENRRKIQCSIHIQATVRSFLVRQRIKEDQRREFDEIALKLQKIQPDNIDEATMTLLVSKILFFYYPDKDIKRLIFVSQKILSNPGIVTSLSNSKTNRWHYKLNKLLVFHLKLATTGRESFATHLRMLDVFTSDIVLAKYLQHDKVTEQLVDIFIHLLNNGYYERFRLLVDERVPPMLEPSSVPPTPFASSLLDLIQRPLKLVSQNYDPNFNDLVLRNFLLTFLSPEFSEPIRYFVLPCLLKYQFFPYSELINSILNNSVLQEDHRNTSWLLFSIVSLEKEQYLKHCEEEQFNNYLNIVSCLSRNFSKLGKVGIFDNREDDAESDNDDDEDGGSVISKQEAEVLEETTIIINKYNTVQIIISKAIEYQDSIYGNQITESLAKICYYLLSAKRYAVHKYKLLCSLALTSQFLRKLWFVIATKEQQTLFGNAAAYINIISRGIELSPNDVYSVVPLFTTFYSLLMLLITTLHDNEFYSEDQGIAKISLMPFSLHEMSQISAVLKELCVGLVELAYPDSNPDFKMSLRLDINPCFSKDNAILNLWTHLFKVSVASLRQLHSRDLRRQFCPEGMWVSSRISMLKFDKQPDFRASTRRPHMRPFSGFPCYTREELEEGPPLSTRELRTMTVIKEMPFLLPFQERVLVFQNHVLKDKLEHQGEAPYAFRGKSIDVSVRRNYLYEDAFDKLSPANEPDLRYVMRVQLRNAVGANEAGVDGGGLSREFLSELLKTAFDPNRGFFRLTNDNQLYPNPHVALLHPDFTKHYYFIGRILGKAMYENLLVELPLAEFFLSKLVSRHSDVSIHHLSSLDPVMYKNLLFLKKYEGDVSDLGLDFTVVTDELGETKVQELKPNGFNIPVSNANKIEYIHLVADYKLNKQIRVQNTSFKKGLADVIQLQWLHMFSNKELQILISGAEIPVDIVDLKRCTKYSGGYHDNHATIQLFWEVLENFDDSQRRLLLKFVTSCSRQPLFGFKELDPPFCIQKAGSTDRLPTASTCMNLLKMPEFNDYVTLRSRLLYAIQAGAGFELS